MLVTTIPIKPGAARRSLDLPRRDLLLWLCAVILFNQLLAAVSQAPSASLGQALSDLAAVSVFQIMAWYAIFRLLASSDPTPVAQTRDILIALVLCLPLFLPTTRTIKVLALIAAIFCWIRGRGDPKQRAAGIVLSALTVQQYWGHIAFDLFAFPLLRAETAVVGTLVQAARAGTVWRDNIITGPSGFGIVVYSGCYSFHNLSLAMLCWVTVNRLRNQNWRSRDLLTGGVIGATMIVFNVARLGLMAWSSDFYEYWHNGLGAQIFAVGASVIVLMLSLYGSRPATRTL